MTGLFRHLSEAEIAEFRKWTRDNYKPFSPIEGIWHPIVQAEAAAMNAEAATYGIRAMTLDADTDPKELHNFIADALGEPKL